MIDAVGHPQSLLLLGGTSDIALAIARRYAIGRRLRIVLAARPTPRRTEAAAELTELGDDPLDLEFFFDPCCPFAWQASVWLRRVRELRGLKIGWRFIALKFVNEGRELPEEMTAAHLQSLRFLRVCAAGRQVAGNDAVDALYRSWGEHYWYGEHPDIPMSEWFGAAARNADPTEIIKSAGLPHDLIDAIDDESWDSIIRTEGEEALRRTGRDVGTPIITYTPPRGGSLFGPVLSSVPDDHTALAMYDAIRTLANYQGFSELKRSARASLDLPLFTS